MELENLKANIKHDEFAKGMCSFDNETYANNTVEYDYYQYKEFSKYLGPSNCEVGAGNGRLSMLVAQNPSVKELLLLEPSPHFFQALKNRFEGSKTNCKITLKSAETGAVIEEFSNSFDTVFSCHVMEHIENDLQFFKECVELTKPGGKTIVMVPALKVLFSNLDQKIGHFRRYSFTDLKTLAEKAGVKLIELRYFNFFGIFPWWLCFTVFGLNYQEGKKKSWLFFKLAKIYSQIFVPFFTFLEAKINFPVGLNLLLVVEKSSANLQMPTENVQTTTKPS